MNRLETTITSIMQQLFNVQQPVQLTRPDEQFGDYSTNVALQLAGQLGQPPRAIAEQLAGAIQEAELPLTEVTVAGPGFINLRLSDAGLLAALDIQPTQTLAGQKVLVEYSDPNPFKPLHAGHLYTTLVGDIIARLVQHAGAETIRLNYNGDVGRHVGISMWAIVRHFGGALPEKLADIPAEERTSWLGQRYVEGTAAFETDESAVPDIRAMNKKIYALHEQGDHDSPLAQIYWTCREWSFSYFKTLYEQLRVTPFDRYIPESEVTPLGVSTVRAQQENGVYTESDGAIVFQGEPFGLHTRVFINSEGLPTYEAKDVGLSLTKWRDYHFDQSIIITANEQAQYMQVVIKSIEQFEPQPVERTRHLTHGFVKLQGGVKMSSRKGNVVSALDILASARAAGAASDNNPSEETILAAVKYALAKNRLGGDIEYDPQESIALEGNSGPYLQYAHARARSILAKAATTADQPAELTSGERSLVRELSCYQETVELATTELRPHHICTYLYELAQTFNRFYEQNRVLGDDREAARLWLVSRYVGTLKAGLELLGITAPDKM